MGLGAGYAIAASLLEKMKPHDQRRPVFCIQGDSAFGFAAMEFETACRKAYDESCMKYLHTYWGHICVDYLACTATRTSTHIHTLVTARARILIGLQ